MVWGMRIKVSTRRDVRLRFMIVMLLVRGRGDLVIWWRGSEESERGGGGGVMELNGRWGDGGWDPRSVLGLGLCRTMRFGRICQSS